MIRPVFCHVVLNIGLAASALSGCEAQTAMTPPHVAGIATSLEAIRESPPIAQPTGSPAWMAPEAKRENLLYVSVEGTDAVNVYSYPQGKLVGILTGFNEPWGLCAESAGDVFVADNWHFRVVEYPHGGLTPIRTFRHDHGHPQSCSIDPTTGNLAVTYYYLPKDRSKRDDIVIYSPTGYLTIYRSPADQYQEFFSCAYDNVGNLFVDGIWGLSSLQIDLLELRVSSKRPVRLINLPILDYLGEYNGMAAISRWATKAILRPFTGTRWTDASPSRGASRNS